MSMVRRPVEALRPRTVFLVLVLTVLVAYAGAILAGGFHFDDLHHVRDNPSVRTLGNLLPFYGDASLWSGEPGNRMYRPTGMVFHALDFALWKMLAGNGLHGPGWVLTNALLHAVASFLVFLLGRRLGLSRPAAFLAALVMALHPMHSEVVNYVSARSESTAAVFVLLALLAHLRARSAARGTRWAYTGLAVLLSFVGLTCKETAATFCAAVVWMELVLATGGIGARLKTAALRGAIYVVPLAVYMLLRHRMTGHAAAPVLMQGWEGLDPQIGGQRTFWANLAAQARAGVLYLQLWLRPLRLAADHDVSVVSTSASAIVAAVVLHAGIAAAAVRELLRGKRLVPLAIGWAYLCVLPSTLIPLNVVMNEHRMYLPGIAVALLAGAALARVWQVLGEQQGRGFATAAVALPLCLFAALAADRSREWRDDHTLWQSAALRSPLSSRAHMHVGSAHHLNSQTLEAEDSLAELDRALAAYARADELHPRWYDLQLNLGGAWLARGRLTQETRDFEQALDAYRSAGAIVGEDKPRPRFLQAAALTELRRYDDAVAMLVALDEADDDVTTIYDDAIARAYRKKGDRAAAMRHMMRVIEIEEPIDRVGGLLTLGWWYFEDGDVRRSEQLLDRALEISKRTGQYSPYLYVARFLNLMGQPGADTFLESALELGWNASPRNVRWVQGGPTPGARTTLLK